MASYSLVLKPSVEKDLRSLPKSAILRIISKMEALQENPTPRQSLKLSGAEHLYGVRVGDYRIIYSIDYEGKQITIQYVRHRREAYR